MALNGDSVALMLQGAKVGSAAATRLAESPFQNLPVEMQVSILAYLSIAERMPMSAVFRGFSHAVELSWTVQERAALPVLPTLSTLSYAELQANRDRPVIGIFAQRQLQILTLQKNNLFYQDSAQCLSQFAMIITLMAAMLAGLNGSPRAGIAIGSLGGFLLVVICILECQTGRMQQKLRARGIGGEVAVSDFPEMI